MSAPRRSSSASFHIAMYPSTTVLTSGMSASLSRWEAKVALGGLGVDYVSGSYGDAPTAERSDVPEDVLLSDRPAASVRRITLNRPDRLNAMTAELCSALHAELADVAADRTCRAVVLTGAGRGFCAGLDLGGYGASPGSDGSDEARDRLNNQEHMSRL